MKKNYCQEPQDIASWNTTLFENETVAKPTEYFKAFFDDSLLNPIVQQTNLFAIQRNPNKGIALTREELEQFLGTITLMSLCRHPRSRLYWTVERRVPMVADTMSRDCWEAIKASLHFNNNEGIPSPDDPQKDQIFKVRPIIDSPFKISVYSKNAMPLCSQANGSIQGSQ